MMYKNTSSLNKSIYEIKYFLFILINIHAIKKLFN